MLDSRRFDAIVIGSGQGGTPLAILELMSVVFLSIWKG